MRLIPLAILLASPAPSEEFPAGCWSRDYSDAHLTAHPDQNVRGLRLAFLTDQYGALVTLEVELADQARAWEEGLAGQVLAQGANCHDTDAGWLCAVDCDGGVIRLLRRDAQTLDIVTTGFQIGAHQEGCGGVFDLAETPGEDTVYRATATSDPTLCEAPR